MAIDVSVIIVNYNTCEMTNECINSIIRHTEGISYEIIVVDNGSVDRSKDVFSKRMDIKYIYSEENVGFGRANNLGAEHAVGEYLFLLNSDTVLIENSIKIMCDFYEEEGINLEIGVLGCILVDREGEFNGCGGEFPTCGSWVKKYKSLLPLMKWFQSPEINIKYPLSADFFAIDYVIGADMLIKRSLFGKMKGFDPMFFMYYEETDLQKRIHKIGFKSYITTKTKIVHLEDASGKSIVNYSNRKRIISHVSRNLYLKKNDPKNFKRYKVFDNLFLLINRVNVKYSWYENSEYIKAVESTY